MKVRPKDSILPLPPENVFELTKILVPVDFSENSNKAVQYAAAFAQQFKATLVLFHAVEPYTALPNHPPMYVSEVEQIALQYAQNQLKNISDSLPPGIVSELIAEIGPTTRAITETARNHAVDLIILSTHGRTGLAHALLGSVAEKITRHAPCPVLIVRNKEKDFVVDAVSRAGVEEGVDLPRAHRRSR